MANPAGNGGAAASSPGLTAMQYAVIAGAGLLIGFVSFIAIVAFGDRDFEYSLTRFFLSRESYVEKSILDSIVDLGQSEFVSGWRSGLVKGVVVESKDTLRIILNSPNPRFLTAFEVSTISLVPREHIMDDGVTWKAWPIGAGPYKIVSVSPDQFALRVAPARRLPEGSPQEIEFLCGDRPDDCDLVLEPTLRVEQQRRGFNTGSTSSIAGVFFDFRHPLANLIDFRRAVQRSVRRADLAKVAPYSIASSNIIPTETLKFYNVRYGDQGGIAPIVQEEKRYDIRIAVARYSLKDWQQQWILSLAEQLSLGGITTEFYEKNCSFFDKNHKDNPFWIVRFIPSYRDPFFLYSVFCIGGSWIAAGAAMDDTQFLNLLRDSRAVTSASDIGSALEALGTLYADQVRGVPLFEIRQVFSVAERFEVEWEEGIQSGTIYFEKIRLKTLAR